MRPHPFLVVALVGALLGFGFASFSTYDFAQHLDRQVHDVHCSFVPGLAEGEQSSAGCEATMMSPYSSVFRGSVWGGIPVSLPAMSVFAFLLFFGADLIFARRQEDPRATGFYALGALIPAVTSAVMGYISLSVLDAACKLCIGIYGSSALLLIGAGGLWLRAWQGTGSGIEDPSRGPGPGEDPAWASDDVDDEAGSELQAREGPDVERGGGGDRISFAMLAGFFGLGVLFVVVPVGAYVGAAPDHSEFIGTCGSLDEPPPEELLVEMGPQRGTPALEVFDPLCPACRGFERRYEATNFDDELARRAVLFPLDDECNWMLDQSVHPGACAVSEAILCGKDQRAGEVIDWAFDHQERIREVASNDDRDVRAMIGEQFPELESCVGSPQVQSELNQSLRWAVDNELKVLTPQFYVDGVRLCDADTDLGLKYSLSQMLKMRSEGRLKERTDSEESTDNDEEGP